MRTEIQLGLVESEAIKEFWKEHGTKFGAMIAQPILFGSRYSLKLRILSPKQAQKLADLLGKFDR